MTIFCALSVVQIPPVGVGATVTLVIAKSPKATQAWTDVRLRVRFSVARTPSSASPFDAPCELGYPFERRSEGVEREGTQEVATQAALDFAESFRSALHPGEIGRFGHFL